MQLLPCRYIIVLLCLGCAACKTPRAGRTEIDGIRAEGLCFRLQDYQQRMAYFEEQGQTQRADAERLKQAAYNRYVMTLFAQNFDFCPVYFFYASRQDALLRGEPVLLNADLREDPSIALPKNLRIAAFGRRNKGENVHTEPRFFVEKSAIEISPAFFMPSSGNKKYSQPEDPPVDPAGLIVRFDRDNLIAKDVYKFNKKMFAAFSNPR